LLCTFAYKHQKIIATMNSRLPDVGGSLIATGLVVDSGASLGGAESNGVVAFGRSLTVSLGAKEGLLGAVGLVGLVAVGEALGGVLSVVALGGEALGFWLGAKEGPSGDVGFEEAEGVALGAVSRASLGETEASSEFWRVKYGS
jgi:hypothetical protein